MLNQFFLDVDVVAVIILYSGTDVVADVVVVPFWPRHRPFPTTSSPSDLVAIQIRRRHPLASSTYFLFNSNYWLPSLSLFLCLWFPLSHSLPRFLASSLPFLFQPTARHSFNSRLIEAVVDAPSSTIVLPVAADCCCDCSCCCCSCCCCSCCFYCCNSTTVAATAPVAVPDCFVYL